MAVRFFSAEYESGSGDGAGIAIKQVTKMNIVAPHTTTIDIPYTARFDKLPVEVLKMYGGEEDIVDTLADFDNADRKDFQDNDFVEFDGVMKLRSRLEEEMDHVEDLGDGRVYKKEIDSEYIKDVIIDSNGKYLIDSNGNILGINNGEFGLLEIEADKGDDFEEYGLPDISKIFSPCNTKILVMEDNGILNEGKLYSIKINPQDFKRSIFCIGDIYE